MQKDFKFPHERFDDLEIKGLHVIQDPDGYCFTSDSVLLANLIKAGTNLRIVEIGTGCGVISILIAAKYRPRIVYGLEIQERLASMAKRSVEYNNLTEKVKIIHTGVRGAEKIIGCDFDVVVSNPPYERAKASENPTEIDICKSEVCLTVEECVASANRLLKFGGLFYMVNKSERLADVTDAMRKNGIEPKILYLVQPKASKPVDVFIIEGKKGAKPSLKIPKPIIVYNEDGSYTEEAKKLYGKEE